MTEMVNETKSWFFQLAGTTWMPPAHSVRNEQAFSWSYEIGSTYTLLIGLLMRRLGHRETCWLAGMEDQWGHRGTAFESKACPEVSGRVL